MSTQVPSIILNNHVDIAEVIGFVVSRPRRLAIHEILLRPAGQRL